MDGPTADRLHAVLAELFAAHEELRSALRSQQRAIRAFDTAGLESMRGRCERLAERITELEATREAMTGPGVRLAELAENLGEPRRSRLVAMALGLRHLAEDTAGLQRVNRAAVQFMLRHFRSIHRALARGGHNGGYGATGKADDNGTAAMLIDAVA